MAESNRDLEALSGRYRDLGFDYSADEIRKFLARIEQAESALDVVRSIDTSGHESALRFVPKRDSDG